MRSPDLNPPGKRQLVVIKSASGNVMQSFFSDITDGNTIQDFPTTYPDILARIDHINPIEYGKTRNFINGAITYLSPYISRGVISLQQVKEAVLQKGYKSYQIERFLQELLWREYFQRVWQHLGDNIRNDIKDPQPDVMHHQMIESVENATTGVEAIDTTIRQLYSSGYMHNHVRMYTASMICNMAKAHWLAPAKWMYYHLLDGDIASNNCSWQWVAAAFSSKKYYFNQENINKYSFSQQQHTFIDKDYAEIISMPVPGPLQLKKDLTLSTTLPMTGKLALDVNKPTLLYNSYNLDPLWRTNGDFNRILLLEPSHFAKYPVSEKVIQFIIALSENIKNIQLYTGEVEDIISIEGKVISKEHPLFTYYPGQKDSRKWLFPQVTEYYPSFSKYWKKCKPFLN